MPIILHTFARKLSSPTTQPLKRVRVLSCWVGFSRTLVDSGEKKWPAGPRRCLAGLVENERFVKTSKGEKHEKRLLVFKMSIQYTHMLHQNGIFMHMWLEFLVGKCRYMYRLNILYMEHLGYSLVGLYFPVVIGILNSPII